MNHNGPSVRDVSSAVTLVFGGCCTNAWSLERLLQDSSSIGSALTFCQLVFIALTTLPSCITWAPYPRPKPRVVPLRTWITQVFVLSSMSLLSNWAFAFHVPLTLQIVFRSAGLGVSMLLGWLFLYKTYTRSQILSVIIVTAGVIIATLSRPAPATTSTRVEAPHVSQYLIGIAMLLVATVLTSTLGILQELTYKRYGAHTWREGVFYTHLLSLPIFGMFFQDVTRGLKSLSSPSITSDIPIPPLYLILLLNITSQSLCVSGANLLGSKVSSVSLNLVLNARKALSLCISVWYFGRGLNQGLGVGAGLVLLGSVGYSVATSAAKVDTPASSPIGNGHDEKTANGHDEKENTNGFYERERRWDSPALISANGDREDELRRRSKSKGPPSE